jgi:hypothetical protein
MPLLVPEDINNSLPVFYFGYAILGKTKMRISFMQTGKLVILKNIWE